VGFFFLQAVKAANPKRHPMTIPGTTMIQVEYRPTSRDEMFAALVHVYLELRLSFQAAHAAAAADLANLDGVPAVAEAAR
jgi:hypothetical protein